MVLGRVPALRRYRAQSIPQEFKRGFGAFFGTTATPSTKLAGDPGSSRALIQKPVAISAGLNGLREQHLGLVLNLPCRSWAAIGS
jgi:hypothetical protein